MGVLPEHEKLSGAQAALVLFHLIEALTCCLSSVDRGLTPKSS
jgi:hypothetical protein